MSPKRSDAGRADRQDIDYLRFTVCIPPVPQKPSLRLPAVGKVEPAPIKHPGEINAVIDQIRQSNDSRVLGESLASGQNTGKKQGGIDGRNFAFPYSLAGPGVKKVEKPSVLLRSVIGKGPESGKNAPAGQNWADPAGLAADAEGRQSEARGSYA